MQIRIPAKIRDELIAHASEEKPNECCGMLGIKDGTLTQSSRATNAFGSPTRFEITGQELFDLTREIEDRGEVVVLYHSHPVSEAKPSQTDINLAKQRFPGLWVIVGLSDPERPECRAFSIDMSGTVDEAELQITQ